MTNWQGRTATKVSRLLCAATLLFVFFLPLHFHFSLTPQLSSQCSCLHGARTPFVVHDNAPAPAPVAPFTTLPAGDSEERNFIPPQQPSVRGPPNSSLV